MCVATIERDLYAGEDRAVVLTVKLLVRPSPDAIWAVDNA
jgi:hypothetical protein